MAHTPYGYKIEHGKAVIDKIKAEQIRTLFLEYKKGLSLAASAKKAGINKSHSCIGGMLECTYYLGDDFYPAIISIACYQSVADERERRAVALGRKNLVKPVVAKKPQSYRLISSSEVDKITSKIRNSSDNENLQQLLIKRSEAIYAAIIGEEINSDGS